VTSKANVEWRVFVYNKNMGENSMSETSTYYKQCEICGLPVYYETHWEHTDCENILSARNASPEVKMRQKFDHLRKKIAPVIFERDGYKCKKCGSIERLTVDHIKPITKGGNNDLGNLQTLCLGCNIRKKDKVE
jgi:5-methylcytosine-specific restriction enzyme A